MGLSSTGRPRSFEPSVREPWENSAKETSRLGWVTKGQLSLGAGRTLAFTFSDNGGRGASWSQWIQRLESAKTYTRLCPLGNRLSALYLLRVRGRQ